MTPHTDRTATVKDGTTRFELAANAGRAARQAQAEPGDMEARAAVDAAAGAT